MQVVQTEPSPIVYRATSTAVRPSSRNRAMSLVGALPKKRPYSLLNCDALKYPTWRLAALASIMVDNMRRLASWRRSTFWYCKGLIEVTDLKCWWKEETLICAKSASSSTFIG